MTDIIDQVRCSGFDANGFRRVFGVGSTRDIAQERCQKAAQDYLVGRPDTGPLSAWTWTFDRRAS
jgi:hypothetical protein